MERYIFNREIKIEWFISIILKYWAWLHLNSNYYHYNVIKINLYIGIWWINNNNIKIFK